MLQWALLLRMMEEEEEEEEERQQREREIVAGCLGQTALLLEQALTMDSIRLRSCYTRLNMTETEMDFSSWSAVVNATHDIDLGFLSTTGLGFKAFSMLLNKFSPILDQLWASREKNPDETWGGRKLLLPADVLGLALYYCKTACDGDSIRSYFAHTNAVSQGWHGVPKKGPTAYGAR